MSDFNDMDLDQDELDELYSDSTDPDDLTPEEVFSMVMLNKIKGTKTTIQLEDKDGDIIELSDIIEQLIGYVKDKLSSAEDTDFTTQVVPMMGQALVSGLGRMIGIRGAAFYLAEENTRHAMIYMMCTGFLLLKYVQTHDLLIHTYEEEASEEEIAEIERKSKASSVATMTSLMGLDPHEVLNKMVETGQITSDDLADLLSTAKKAKSNGNKEN
jgi:hypothetical protein